jgi:hypothetical protein
MARTLGVTDLGMIDASSWPAWTAGLLTAGRPRLVAAQLSGGAIALGRFQRHASVLTPRGRQAQVVHRQSGGRAIAIGTGVRAVALSLPHRSWLLGDDPEMLPTARFLNQAVRGILSGLTELGCPAHYFGRDFITANQGQAAYLSFDVDGQGRALLECFLGIDAHWSLPSDCNALPLRPLPRGVPGPVCMESLQTVNMAQLLDGLGRGYSKRFPVEVTKDDTALKLGAVEDGEVELPRWSSLREVSVGFIECGLQVLEGRIGRAAFRGDFMADSGGVQQLEESLRGADASLATVAAHINAIYGKAAHAMIGVTNLSVWADALREAGLS